MKYLSGILTAGALFLVSSTAMVAGESVDSMEELYQMISPKEMMMETMMSTMQPMLDSFKQSGMPDEKIAKIKEVFTSFASKVSQDEELHTGMLQVYKQHFNEAEAAELVGFYKTPLGQKTLKTLPALMQEGAAIGQRIAEKYQEELKDGMMQIMSEE